MNIADLRRSSACSRSNCRRFAHITAQREAFLGSSPARASATARAASSGCWLTYGLSAGRCFQRLKIDLLLSLAASSAAARARRRRLPRPRRAQGRSIRPLCCGIIRSRLLTPCPSVVFAGAQDEGKGEGRRGRHHQRVLRQHDGRCLAPTLHTLPRAAGRSNRPLCGKVACSVSCMLSRVVDSVVRLTGEKGRGEEAS